MTENENIVSFDDEKLILVDTEDNILGYEEKLACHMGAGKLHRAFSIFIFNSKRELLLQKRSAEKLLWPLIWSNSCCSHPRKGEEYEHATHRRLKEELGIDTDLKYLFKFKYQVPYKNVGSEHELCSVFIGKCDDPVAVNPTEISEWEYISIAQLNRDMEEQPEKYSPWFKMEWQRIREIYMGEVEKLFK
jgi:isopentenyl-diphosphate delta-isomerase